MEPPRVELLLPELLQAERLRAVRLRVLEPQARPQAEQRALLELPAKPVRELAPPAQGQPPGEWRHPAVVAGSPQAPVTDYYLGDDVYHNGAFMLAANFGFYQGFRPREGDPALPPAATPLDYGTPDGYEFYLGLGSLANSEEKYFKHKNPWWTEDITNTDYDEYWQSRSIWKHLTGIKPAAMVVGVIPLLFAAGAGASSRFSMGLVIVSGLSTLGVMFAGLVSMARGPTDSVERARASNKLMWWRVRLQFLTLIFILLWWLTRGS